MVDFNNETTITRPAHDVMKITTLQVRYEAREALGWYQEHAKAGTSMGKLPKLNAAIAKYFWETEQMLKNRLKPTEYADLLEEFEEAKDFTTLLKIHKAIEAQLYDVGLTKIDTGRRYDSTRAETENREKGL